MAAFPWFQRALALLERRDYSRLELRRKLLRAAQNAAAKLQGNAQRCRVSDGDADGADAEEGDGEHDWSRRNRCAAELTEDMLSACDDSLDRLCELGYLDDTRYAGSRVNQRQGRCGNLMLKHDLRLRGVADEVIATALDGVADEEVRCREVWRRRFKQAPQDDKERARQIRFLCSRGFSPVMVGRVLRSVGAGHEINNDGNADWGADA